MSDRHWSRLVRRASAVRVNIRKKSSKCYKVLDSRQAEVPPDDKTTQDSSSLRVKTSIVAMFDTAVDQKHSSSAPKPPTIHTSCAKPRTLPSFFTTRERCSPLIRAVRSPRVQWFSAYRPLLRVRVYTIQMPPWWGDGWWMIPP